MKERHKNTHIHTKTLNPDLNPAKKNDDDDTPEKKVFFLDAPAGTGKTFVLNQLLAYVRSRGKKFVSTGNRIRVSTASALLTPTERREMAVGVQSFQLRDVFILPLYATLFAWQGNVLPLNHGDKFAQNSIFKIY